LAYQRPSRSDSTKCASRARTSSLSRSR
jgi:hypothetical protein